MPAARAGGPLLAPLVLLLQLSALHPDDPRAVIRHARLAVEGDSVGTVGARWSARLASDSLDRAALLGLGTLARFRYDDSAAGALYGRLLPAPGVAPDRYAVYAMLALGRIRYDAIQVASAESILIQARDAARALGDSAAQGDALVMLGNVWLESKGSEVTLALVDSALALYPARETDFAAAARCRRAGIMFSLGSEDFERDLASALEYARRHQLPRTEATCLRTAAHDQRVKGNEDSALALLQSATDLMRRTHDQRALAYTLTVRADILRDIGSYGEAKRALEESLAEAQASGYTMVESLVLHLMGTLYFSLRDIPTASGYLDRALVAFQANDDTTGVHMVRSWQADIALANGDLAGARRLTEESIAFYERVENIPYTIELYQTLGHVAVLERDWAAAGRALDRSEALVREHSSEAWGRKLAYQRGRLALHQDQLDVAERAFRRYLSELEADDWLRRHEARAYLADALARRGDLAGAERELTAAGEELDAWRATLTDRELRVWAFQASASDESDRNSSVARVVSALAAGGRVAPAFAMAERRRARELGDRMLGAAAWHGGTAGRRDDGTTEQRQNRRSAFVGQAEIAALIPDDQTALIEFVTGALGAPTTAFVVTRARTAGGGGGGGGIAVRLAPADSLTGEIARFVALVARGEAEAVAAPEGSALERLLLEPVLAQVPAGVVRLVIVPDGPLHRVPWDALRLPDGRYLVERYAIALSPSAGVLAALWNRPKAAQPPGTLARVLAFGDPAFSPDTAGYAAVFAAHGGLPRLRGSGREARNVALHSDHGEVRLRQAATAEYLLRNPMDSYGVIHLATHAVVDDRAISGTALALAPGGSDDGFVTPGDLASLRLDAGVVVLSACRTAGGVVVDGEGIQGLTAPLLQAGARSVVATSWRVRDRATVQMVNGFYEELAAGKPVAEALRAAKLAAIERGEAPAVWAAFTVVGDPLTLVPLQSTGPVGGSRLVILLVAVTGLLAAALAASLAYQRRTRRERKGEARGSDPSVTSRTHQR